MNSNYPPNGLGLCLIPKPVQVRKEAGFFLFTPHTEIFVSPQCWPNSKLVADLAAILSLITGTTPKVSFSSGSPPAGSIHLATEDGQAQLGSEGYFLKVNPDAICLKANQPQGLFYGIQTIKQLILFHGRRDSSQSCQIAGVTITDYPRFSWRGAMLDVARNFFSVGEVKRFIDYLAAYKLNRLHLHLSNDQGWRIMINSWPNLALHGGKSAVSGGNSGYYSQEEYREIVTYAQSKWVTVVPEIDMPGHTTAALASYPKLNRGGRAPSLYSGTEVGFSSLAPEKEITYRFVADVLGELAALTPGPYLHVGGDEALSTTAEEYSLFLGRLQPIVAGLGKIMVGWGEIAHTPLKSGTIVQIWRKEETDAVKAAAQGVKTIISPAHHLYMDMKYNQSTALGLSWAGLITVKDAYNWDPARIYAPISEDKILGVEACLWAETLRSRADLEYMVFPRLAGYGEIGWSPQKNRGWEEYSKRLAPHGQAWGRKGINFYRSPEVPWRGRD